MMRTEATMNRVTAAITTAAIAMTGARANAQQFTDFRFKAAHNAYERPMDGAYNEFELSLLYNLNLNLLTIDLLAGRGFHMLVEETELRIPFGVQTSWLNTWCLELDICWNRNGYSRVRHFPGMASLNFDDVLREYWLTGGAFYGTRDRLTVFWLDWKGDFDCSQRNNDDDDPTNTDDAAARDLQAEILSIIPAAVVFGRRDLLEFNGLDPSATNYTVSELEWPSPQWMHRNGFRLIFVSQVGSAADFFITRDLIANQSDTNLAPAPRDGRLTRMWPNLSAAPEDFVGIFSGIQLIDALGEFNPWNETSSTWELGMANNFNIVATNDIRSGRTTSWDLTYPNGFRWAPPMPMYLGGPVVSDPFAVQGSIARPYSRLRFIEQHLRLTETINGTGITEAWPVYMTQGTHGIDHINQTNRFEPRVPMRLEAKPGQTVRLVPGPG